MLGTSDGGVIRIVVFQYKLRLVDDLVKACRDGNLGESSNVGYGALAAAWDGRVSRAQIHVER